VNKDYHCFFNKVKFLGGLKWRKRVEGEHKSILFTPTLSLPEGVKKLGWRWGMDAKLKKLGLNFRNNLSDQL
jgi:hypothetical protein